MGTGSPDSVSRGLHRIGEMGDFPKTTVPVVRTPVAPDVPGTGRKSRCLWIARELPFPLNSGDRVYSAGLATALAGTGVEVVFAAQCEDLAALRLPEGSPVRWHPVEGRPHHPVKVALVSPLPLAAGIRATPAFRAGLRTLLAEGFDAVVLDQLGSGWALDVLATQPGPRPVVLYLAHNHERTVWSSMAQANRQSLPRRIAIQRNADKVARLEARLLRSVDRVFAITDADARAFEADGAPRPVTVLTPGYSGPAHPPRRITAATPRRIVMVGSYAWVIKEENLRQFLAIADARFHAAGIHFDLVGMMPPAFAAELKPRLKATTLHGYVADLTPLFDRARMAIVPEMIGGGFKLKLLDYLFAGLPIATVAPAAAGLSRRLRRSMMLADDLPRLVDRIVASIDDTDRLDALQRQARALAEGNFRWEERGQRLRATIESLVALRRSQNA